jgi:hypothetical protein
MAIHHEITALRKLPKRFVSQAEECRGMRVKARTLSLKHGCSIQEMTRTGEHVAVRARDRVVGGIKERRCQEIFLSFATASLEEHAPKLKRGLHGHAALMIGPTAKRRAEGVIDLQVMIERVGFHRNSFAKISFTPASALDSMACAMQLGEVEPTSRSVL